MARLGLGRKREEEEQARQAMSEQEAAVVEGRDYAKNTAAAMQATKHHVVAEHPTNPFEQTAKKTDAQIIADYDAEMAARDGMAPGNPKADTGYNDISVDFSSIKSNEQAAYFASTLHDETTKAEFLKDWAKYSKQDSETVLSGAEDLLGTRLFAQPVSETGKNKAKEAALAKTRTDAMQELSGLNLMGFDGQSINVNTADPATVVRGINSIADDDLRAKGQKLYKTLTETPGSRFYGESTDGVGDFLESANLTKSEYREKTDDYQSLFYGDGAHKQEDAQNYLDARQEIEESEYSAYAKAQLTAALDKAYQGITGTATPSASADDTAIEADDREQETEEGEKRGFLAKAGDGLSQFVSGLSGTPPDDAAQTDKEKRGEAMQAQFGGEENGGNVDLTHRPQVSYETMKAAGWGDYTEPGGVSTVLTTGYGAPEDGFMAQMTPIREDGSVLTPEELDAYYDRVAEAVKGGKSVAEADPDHLVLASKQGTPKELEGEKQWLDEYGEALHEAQAAYYDETPKEVQGPVQQKEMTPEEKIVSQGGMSFEEWVSHPYTAAASPISSKGEVGDSAAGQSGKKEAQTVGEAAGALLSGEYDSIEGAGKDELDRMLEGSAYARRMIGTLTEEDSRRVLVGNDMAEMVTYGSIAAQGQKIKTLYDAMQSDSFPAELRGDVLAQMVAWASQAEKMEQAGTLGGDTELPLMERLLTTDEQAMDELESIYAARDELLADKAEMRRAREEENAQALSDAREAALNGTASEEQLALVRENAQVDQDELNADMGYVGRLAAVDDYFRPGAGKNAVSPFEAGSVKLNLDAQGVTDTAAYESALNGQMGVLLEEDAQTAHALGLTLDEYYQKTGGLDMDALCERAASRISRQGASITEEEMTALEAPFGQGVGAGYTLGAGIRAGGEQWYLDFKDSLYVGYSQGMVTRNAARIQNRYQNEYGAYGRTQYKKDIQAALDSGTLDENYAEALKKALASAADVYQLGIDPLDFEGDFLKNSAEARRDIATLKGYMRENATQDEYKWFGRVESMTYNAVSAGVSTAATLLTGNNLAGFATGYSVVGFKNNFDEYLQKGYSINAAKQLAAVDTGIECAVNIGTRDKIIGQLTGMSTLSEAAKNVIVRNPAGACKGLAAIRAFGKAFIQNEFDEVVHDEFFEGLGANWTDNALGEIYRKLDAGEEITFTDGLKLALNMLNPQNLDVKGAAEGVVSGAVENAIGAVMFSLSGATGAAVGSLRGVQAAHDLMSGKRDDVQQVIKEVTETLGDEQACALLDSYAEQQKESQATAEELVSGKDEHGSLSAARHAQADAQRHEGKAQEAARTMEATAQIIEEKQTAIENGEGDALAAQELSDAAMAYAKAKKDYAEQTAMAEHRKDDADTAIDRRVQDARQEARQAIRREQEAAREALSEDRQARAAGIDSELEALNAQDEALQNEFTEALSGLSDAQEMEMDEDTIAQLMARTDEIAERMAALEEARERLSNPEAYSTQEEAAQTEPTEQAAQAEQAAQNGQAAQSAQAEPNVQIAPNAQDAQTMQAAQTEQIVQSAPQNAQTEETAQTAGSQYSVGTVGREAGQSGVDAGGLKNPVFQKFASVIYKNHGTEIVVANLMDGAKSAYDPRTNRLYISSKLGTGTAMREALVHELMHSVEGSRGYEAYKEAAMQAAYHGNRADMQHDIERIQEVYGAVYEREGRTLTETDVQKELVTRATEKVIEQLAGWTKTGGETQIYDLLGEKQRFGVRLYNQLTQFIAKRKAKKNGTLEAYNELVRARDALKEALQGAKGAEKDQRKQYALELDRDSHYDYSKPFAEQVEDWKNGKIPKGDALLVGRTPEILRQIGLSDVPMTFDQKHTDYAVNGTKADHQMSMEMIKQLPELLKNPIAIIGSETRASDSLVAIIEATINGKPVIAPITIQTTSEVNGIQIDANHLASAYGKKNAVRLLENAIKKENADSVGVYYLDKNRASNLISDPRVQFPSVSEKTGLIHSIFDAGSPVKRKYLEQTETRQFKRWFKDSKVVDENGAPLTMYHGTRAENGDFHVFDYSKAVKKGGLGMKALGVGNYFTATRLSGNERYGSRVIEAYLSIKQPFEIYTGETFKEVVQNKMGLDTKEMSYDAIQQAMKEHGYDGVIQRGKDGNVALAVTFSSEQIKSATDNVGLFAPENPDIRYALNLNQFGNERTRAADNLYDEIRKDMGQNAGINRRQVEEANRQYETRGAEDLIAELSTKEMWTADDVAQAAVLRKRAENEGHLMQAAMMEQMYRERMTRAGAALQAGSIYKKLTASGAMAESLDRANAINRKRGLTDGMIPMGDSAPVMNWREQRQRAKTSLQYALMTDEQQQTAQDYERIIFKQAPESIYDLYEAAYETQKAAEKKLHVEQISRDNPWGLPIEDWKMELIDRYKLRGTKLPGYDYFKASKKERMLAAILATRSNERGHGLLTLCQQLEFMDAGYAVVTEADLNYITGEMATFQMLEEGNDEPQTPEGKTAIQRIYSAQANTMPNSLWGKWNNYGYDSMLSSPKTWNKNVMSNILTRPLELTSEKIAEFADKQIAKKTGNRTTAMPGREGRRAGKEAFAEEIANTLTDYLIRGTDTGHSSSFDLNNNRRTYDNAFMQTYHDFIAMAMQLGDRPFWEQCYAEEMWVLEELDTKAEELRRTEDGNEEVVLRKMNQKEREEEAARRATERVFQEDNVLINGINYVRGRSRAADLVITSLMPFLKTPTNVAIRAMQYSPMGLAYTVVKNGLIDSKTNNGLGFDQRKFVMNLGRGLTGTGLMVAGMAMANAGLIKPGREDEDDSRLSAIEKSNGKSYGMYFDVFGTEIPVDFAFPAVSPMIIGAEVAQTIADHADSEDGVALALDVTKAMAAASLDQLCDNSMLQGVSGIFRGYKDNAQIVTAVLEGMAENTASRLTPASIRAVAKYTDPYVRDTKSQNGIRELLNAQIVQNWPILRQTLPKAQTITGEDMLQTGANSWGKDKQNAALHFLNSFITPWTAGSETQDEKLDELVELAYSTGETSFLPGTLVDGNKYSVTINKTLAKALKIGRVGVGQYESVTLHLTDEEKRWANSAYADALWNGSGRDVTGLRKLMDSRKWQRMNDEAKMTAVKEEAAKAKKAVLEEMVRRR